MWHSWGPKELGNFCSRGKNPPQWGKKQLPPIQPETWELVNLNIAVHLDKRSQG